MSSYGSRPCPHCGYQVTTNALGRAAHLRGRVCMDARALREQHARARSAYRWANRFGARWARLGGAS